jgi:predicted secreted protein
MTRGDREGLTARIRQVRRLAALREQRSSGPEVADGGRMRALETRVEHLERMVEGLQDSVYREFERHDKLIAELQAQIQPGAMGAALADDARSRGL